MKTIICTLILLATPFTFAANTKITDTWEGTGTVTQAHGNDSSKYSLLVEKEKGEGSSVTHVTVTLADGTTQQHVCKMIEGSQGSWKSECDHGSGGGRCLTEGLCISYEDAGAGKAFATNIVMDGPKDMRLLRTELQDGKAVRFFSEKLHKR
jgi:hypothetical protein